MKNIHSFCVQSAYFYLLDGLSFVYVQSSELKFDAFEVDVSEVNAANRTVVHCAVKEALVV